MALNTKQKQLVTTWVVAGDSLSAIQKKIIETFKISMTYMDVRFLVDDLNLMIKDAPAKKSTDLSQPVTKSESSAEETVDEAETALDPLEDDQNAAPAAIGNAIVTVDKVTLIPGAIASGTVAFSDGVTGKWIIDNQGRPGFITLSQKTHKRSCENLVQQCRVAVTN